MRRFLFLFPIFFAVVHAFGQSAAPAPDYLGFYALNIPRFSWQEGAKVEAQYSRLSGLLNLDHTSKPLFEVEGHDPIPLTLDQTSRLLLSVKKTELFDLVGLEGKSTEANGAVHRFFVAFEAIVGDKTINLAPSLTKKETGASGGGRPSGGPGGPGGMGGPR